MTAATSKGAVTVVLADVATGSAGGGCERQPSQTRRTNDTQRHGYPEGAGRGGAVSMGVWAEAMSFNPSPICTTWAMAGQSEDIVL
ncbi:hypothetical protein MVI01_41510 [Myxococcus virescens]|uniref:Uncharacterized protein n=1 Tax=Myxococcus virescens TaxID=83456 RepID=A0A511HFN4_9BACT|nr:hypothetical protein MVI01_41510 [Myxococcus virescens]